LEAVTEAHQQHCNASTKKKGMEVNIPLLRVCSSDEQSVCDNVGFSQDMCLHRSRLVEFLLLNIGVD
jgi:hypothetical protein